MVIYSDHDVHIVWHYALWRGGCRTNRNAVYITGQILTVLSCWPSFISRQMNEEISSPRRTSKILINKSTPFVVGVHRLYYRTTTTLQHQQQLSVRLISSTVLHPLAIDNIGQPSDSTLYITGTSQENSSVSHYLRPTWRTLIIGLGADRRHPRPTEFWSVS